MHKEEKKGFFTQLEDLTFSNVAMTPSQPGLYMICQKDKLNNNQVIFAGVTNCLKSRLTKYLEDNISGNNLTFCYSSAPVKSTLVSSKSPLYERVA